MIRYLPIIQDIQIHLRKVTSRYRLGMPLPLPLRARWAAPGGARGPEFCCIEDSVISATND